MRSRPLDPAQAVMEGREIDFRQAVLSCARTIRSWCQRLETHVFLELSAHGVVHSLLERVERPLLGLFIDDGQVEYELTDSVLRRSRFM